MKDWRRLIKTVQCDSVRTEYHVKGADGWTYVTNSKELAIKAAKSSNRNFGEGRVSCRNIKRLMRW